MLLKIAGRSLWHRRATASLTTFAIAISLFVLLGIDTIRHEARQSFYRTVSGVDLIVGARSGSLNLLLFSVFRMGAPTNNVRWSTYADLSAHPQVAWTLPFSLGDSHQGYPVLGTHADYFVHYGYGNGQRLTFREGRAFAAPLEVVLGADVARKLHYQLGDELVLMHGMGRASFTLHDHLPFKVTGILAPTGTPVDRTLHVSLAGLEAVHLERGRSVTATALAAMDLQPRAITGFMVGLHSRTAIFQFQRQVNEYRAEPLSAVLPGVALSELWQIVGAAEKALRVVAFLALVSALLGMTTMLMASLRERRREIAVIRTLGGSPLFVFALIQLEALLMVALGACLSLVLLQVTLNLAQDTLGAHFGLFLQGSVWSLDRLQSLLWILVTTALFAALPALMGLFASRRAHLLGLSD